MEKLLEFITKAIVESPEKVKIKKKEENGLVNLSLKVDPEDLKIVIGKKGRTIRAIRNLLRLKAIKEKVRFNLELEDEKSRRDFDSSPKTKK